MGKRFDVIAKGPTVLSSHDLAKEAAEAAKAAAVEKETDPSAIRAEPFAASLALP